MKVALKVLDPAYAPATGTPEIGGWTTRELLTILDGLSGIELIGADVGKKHRSLVTVIQIANGH